MGFIMRNLRKVQGKRGVNTLGEPEIPRIVFEELLVNALVHRDYFISAPIRIFVFADRVEIISPGHLPNHLTIEKIKAGNSNIRNPILASFVAKGLLPYRGLGTGIRRAFEDWDQIELKDDPEACTFKASIQRLKVQKKADSVGKTTESVEYEPINEPINELQVQILRVIKVNPRISYDGLAMQLDKGRSTIMRHIRALKEMGILTRTGARKTGRWEIKRITKKD